MSANSAPCGVRPLLALLAQGAGYPHVRAQMHIVASISLAVLLASALTACSREIAVVRIFPDRYEIGSVSSELATPAVDEAVRLKPIAVHMYVCLNTAPQKAIQFQLELDARYKGEVKLGFMEKDQCPA